MSMFEGMTIAPSARRGNEKKKKKNGARAVSSESHRSKQAKISRKKNEENREIGPLPPVVDQKRKDLCKDNLGRFQRVYLGNAFSLDPGSHHVVLNRSLQNVIKKGRKQAMAFPRGDGKTTTCISAAAWGLLYGHVNYLVIIAAKDSQAKKILRNIKRKHFVFTIS